MANWVSAAKRGTTPSAAPGSRTVTELEADNAKLRRELTEASMERDIVKKNGSVLCAAVAAKYALMKTMRLEYPIAVMCRALDVSRCGYYAWASGVLSPRAQANERLKVAIKAVHKQSRETYGPLRMQPELAEQGSEAGRDRIARLSRIGLALQAKAQIQGHDELES